MFKFAESDQISIVNVMAAEVENREDEEDGVSNEDNDEIMQKMHINITIFSTNGRKSDLNSEKDKYYMKVKTKKKNKKRSKLQNLKNSKHKEDVTSEFDFLNMSLFPRPSRVPMDDDDSALERYYAVENDLDELENMVAPYEKELNFEGSMSKTTKHHRVDRDRKIRKAHVQVKDKYCTNIRNNAGRKHLFIHHRVYKLMILEIRRICYMPSPTMARLQRKRDDLKLAGSSGQAVSRPVYYTPRQVAPRAGAQNLAYALDNHNAAGDLDSALINLLITLQHRDLTPEDYDTLLQLDDTVAPKTLDQDIIASFKTDIVDANSVGDTCAICMDLYELGQSRKFLPCNHVFHTFCIEMWLNNSSLNCPIDNLSVDVSNR